MELERKKEGLEGDKISPCEAGTLAVPWLLVHQDGSTITKHYQAAECWWEEARGLLCPSVPAAELGSAGRASGCPGHHLLLRDPRGRDSSSGTSGCTGQVGAG